MRILSIIAQKPSATGSGVYLAETVKSFIKEGQTCAVLYGRAPEDKIPDFLQENCELFPVNFESENLPFAICGMSNIMPYKSTRYCDMTQDMVDQFVTAFKQEITAAIEQFKPDLIICHHLYIVSAIACSVARRISRMTRIVAISHGTDIRQMKQHDLINDYVRENIKLADHIFALHEEQKEECASVYGLWKNKISIIGCGYNSDIFNAEEEKLRAENKTSVLFVGKIAKAKGVMSLVRAFENFKSQNKNATLTLVGGHSSKSEFEKIQTFIDAQNFNITQTGSMPPKDVADQYRSNHIFCLPSFFEGLPLVPLEAIACGCVCVVSSLPGVKKWYEQNAPKGPIIFVEPPRIVDVDRPVEEDLESYEERLAAALDEASKMEANPKSVEHLSWDNLSENILDTLN